MTSAKILAWKLMPCALAVAAPVGLLAAEPWAYQVYQPFNLPDGIAVSPVTYTGYYWPGREVEMTCWANRIWHPDRDWRGTENKSRQENVAFEAGIRVEVDSGFMNLPHAAGGDTVRAVLDVSRLASRRSGIEWADTALIEATVECMKANAGQHGKIGFILLRIRGPREYARFGGVFAVDGYRCGPKKRQFY
jgi:hypothetical protein